MSGLPHDHEIRHAAFNPLWRKHKSTLFDLERNSTARETLTLELWGRTHRIYANANLSVYSAQPCNARCPFCVEELRPASRGSALEMQKSVELGDERYLSRLASVLEALRPLNPSVSVTGGEPSIDRRLPRILRTLEQAGARKRTMTTNGSGLLHLQEGRRVIDWVADTGLEHLNISVAHPEPARSARLMNLPQPLELDALRQIVRIASAAGTRVRLSCVLLKGEIQAVPDLLDYLSFASEVGVDNVIFRQLMQVDARTVRENFVTRYSDMRRVSLEPLLDRLSLHADFEFVRQVMGYYYYVEVWRHRGMDVVFEEADLAQLEGVKASGPGLIHELIFHPNAQLCSTWQPWDGVLGP